MPVIQSRRKLIALSMLHTDIWELVAYYWIWMLFNRNCIWNQPYMYPAMCDVNLHGLRIGRGLQIYIMVRSWHELIGHASLIYIQLE